MNKINTNLSENALIYFWFEIREINNGTDKLSELEKPPL